MTPTTTAPVPIPLGMPLSLAAALLAVRVPLRPRPFKAASGVPNVFLRGIDEAFKTSGTPCATLSAPRGPRCFTGALRCVKSGRGHAHPVSGMGEAACPPDDAHRVQCASSVLWLF